MDILKKESKLFTPYKLGPVTLRNRTIRSAAFENMATDNSPSKMLYDYHRSVAAGGIGMTTGNNLIDLAINTIINIVLVIIISILFLSVVRGLMGRYKTNQMFKFYWTVPTILSLLSYILVSFSL